MSSTPAGQSDDIEAVRKERDDLKTANEINLDVIKVLIQSAGGEIVVTRESRAAARNLRWGASTDPADMSRTVYRTMSQAEYDGHFPATAGPAGDQPMTAEGSEPEAQD